MYTKDQLILLLKSWIKKICSDLHSTAVQVVAVSLLVVLFGWAGGLIPQPSIIKAIAWLQTLFGILKLPIPLWATISLLLLIYIYLRFRKSSLAFTDRTAELTDKIRTLESEKQITKQDANYYSSQSDKFRIDNSDLQSQLSSANKSIESAKQINAKLTSDNTNLRMANDELAAKLKEYENPQNNLLDTDKTNILKMIYMQDNLTSEQIAQSLNFQLQTAKYHLEELSNLQMITSRLLSRQTVVRQGAFGPVHGTQRFHGWTILQKGRKYILDNNLAS